MTEKCRGAATLYSSDIEAEVSVHNVPRTLAALGLVTLLSLAQVGCAGGGTRGTTDPKFEDVIRQGTKVQRVSRPLSEWVMLRPDELHLINRKRLIDDKAVLILARSKNSPKQDAPPRAMVVSGISSISNSKVMPLLKSEKSQSTGWGVVLVKPGRYGDLVMGMTIRTKNENGRLISTPVPAGSTEEVLRARERTPTISVKAGEVVYAGTRVWDRKNGKAPSSYQVINEESAARSWLRAHAPSLGSTMTVRLFPVPPKRQRSAAAANAPSKENKKPN